jgi:hypothetical protein
MMKNKRIMNNNFLKSAFRPKWTGRFFTAFVCSLRILKMTFGCRNFLSGRRPMPAIVSQFNSSLAKKLIKWDCSSF